MVDVAEGRYQHCGVGMGKESVTNDIRNTRIHLKPPVAEARDADRAVTREAQSPHRAPVGECVGMVFLMPLNVGRHERSFWVHVRLVMARVRIEEAHERSVRNKRHDARTLIFEGL